MWEVEFVRILKGRARSARGLPTRDWSQVKFKIKLWWLQQQKRTQDSRKTIEGRFKLSKLPLKGNRITFSGHCGSRYKVHKNKEQDCVQNQVPSEIPKKAVQDCFLGQNRYQIWNLRKIWSQIQYSKSPKSENSQNWQSKILTYSQKGEIYSQIWHSFFTGPSRLISKSVSHFGLF